MKFIKVTEQESNHKDLEKICNEKNKNSQIIPYEVKF